MYCTLGSDMSLPQTPVSFYSPSGLKAVAHAIDAFLDRREMSQNRLAALVEISPNTLNSIRRNRDNVDGVLYSPEPETILKIASWIGEDPEELLLMARGFSPTEYVSRFTTVNHQEPPERQMLKRFKKLSTGGRLTIAGDILRILSEDFSGITTDAIFSFEEVRLLCESLLKEFLRVLEAEDINLSNDEAFHHFCDRLAIHPTDALAIRLRELALLQNLSKQREKTDLAALKLAVEQLTGQAIDLNRFRLTREDCDCTS